MGDKEVKAGKASTKPGTRCTHSGRYESPVSIDIEVMRASHNIAPGYIGCVTSAAGSEGCEVQADTLGRMMPQK